MTEFFGASDDAFFRRVMSEFATGVTIVTAIEEGRPAGMTCQAFTSVSLDPPLVALFGKSDSTSWQRIVDAGSLCVNVLSTHQEILARIFATPGVDKYRDVSWTPSPNGSPMLSGSIAWIDSHVETRFDAGDHTGVLCRVDRAAHGVPQKPLLYHRGGYGGFVP